MSNLTAEAEKIRAEEGARSVPLRIAPVPAGGAWIEGENFVNVPAGEFEDARLLLHQGGLYRGRERLKELMGQ